MAYDLLDGKEVPDEVVIDSYPIYRQSCGCVDATSRTSSYVDRQGNYHATDAKDNFASFNHTRSQFASVYYFLNMMDSDSHFDDFLNNIHNYAKQGGVPAIAMSFYDHPVTLNREDIFTLPDSARLFCLYNETKNINKSFYADGGVPFNPADMLLPYDYKDDEAGFFMLYPIFSKRTNYGYLLTSCSNGDFIFAAIFLKFFVNSIVQAYEYTKSKIQNDLLIERNQNLSFQSKTDELTKILNRRGFMQYGQQLLDTSLALAIQTQAKVLKAAFCDSDLIGRLSGDEFGVVAPGSVVRKVDVLRERLIGLNKKLSEEAGLPFTLSISVGPIEFTNENSDLQKLLQDADQQLYEEKHVKHGKND